MAGRKPRKPTHEVVVLRAKAPGTTYGVPKSSVGELYTPLVTGSSIESDYEPTESYAGETYTALKTVDSDYEETEPTEEEIYTPMKTGSSVESDYEPTEPYDGEIYPSIRTDSRGERDSTQPHGHGTKPGHQRLFPMVIQNNYTQQARNIQQARKIQQMRKLPQGTRKLQQASQARKEMMIKPPSVAREDTSEDNYEPVSVYENVCDFVAEETKKKVARPKPKPRAIHGRKTERQGGQRRQVTHEVVVLPANPTHKTPQAEDDNYTPLKTIRHTPGTYETTQLHNEEEEDEDEYENVDM